jgi:DNA-binding XRE family transcriptional regulator
MHPTLDPLSLILSRVTREPETSCWLWLGAASSDGYGVIKMRGRQGRTHRILWELVKGPIPIGMMVCHRCDRPLCVNPAHLFLGTAQDNVLDAISKGRWNAANGERHYSRLHPERRTHGERHGMAKLTEAQAASILARCEAGERQADIARDLGVSKQMVNVIATGKKWKHLRRTAIA